MKKKKQYVLTRFGKGWILTEAGLLGATGVSLLTGHPEIASPLFASQLAVVPSLSLAPTNKLKGRKKLKKVME
jgi:hypothetical protein